VDARRSTQGAGRDRGVSAQRGGPGPGTSRDHPAGAASWAPDDEAAHEASREWKGTLVEENYTEPVSDPAEGGARGSHVSDAQFKMMGLISSDPDMHVQKIKAMQQLGATAVVVMNISGADPLRDAAHLREARASHPPGSLRARGG
jgi:coenzyme F420-dependent glucose-6-phosphate dehydrogenase